MEVMKLMLFVAKKYADHKIDWHMVKFFVIVNSFSIENAYMFQEPIISW